MTKLIIALLTFSVMPFPNLFAQTNPTADFIENYWTYKEYSSGNVQAEIEKNFIIHFSEDGKGHLSITITCTAEGSNAVTLFGNVGFSYITSADPDDPSRTWMEVTYGKLSIEAIRTNTQRTNKTFDETMTTDLMNQLSENTVSYYLQRTGKYLVVEGFEQNEQSQFTYFSSRPTFRE